MHDRPDSGGRPRHSRRALEAHRLLLRSAFAFSHVFAWVLIFHYFYFTEGSYEAALSRSALLFALAQIVACLATPAAAPQLRRGVRRAMRQGTVLAAAAFALLGITLSGAFGGAGAGAALVLFAAMMGLYRAAYRIPYTLEAEDGSSRRTAPPAEGLVALMPALGGLVVAGWASGLAWMLFGAAGAILLSLVPLAAVREFPERFSWGYRETFGHLMDRRHREIVSRSVVEGVGGAALLFFWPVAVFVLLEESYGLLGIVLSLAFVLALLLRPLARIALPKPSRLTSAVLAVSPWVMRLGVATPLGVVLVDSYAYSSVPSRQGIDHPAFEQYSDGGHFLDEYTALKEMAIAIGKLTAAVFGGIAAVFLPLPLALAAVIGLAALASLAHALWHRRENV